MEKLKIKFGGGLNFLAISLGISALTEAGIKLANYASRKKDVKRLEECNEVIKEIGDIIRKLDSDVKDTVSEEEEAQ